MKFHQLPIGSRFRLEGDSYVKSGPLAATLEHSGEQRLVRRSAEVSPVDPLPQPPATPARLLDADAVRAALETCHRRCLAALDGDPGGEPADELDAAWRELFATLGLTTEE